MANFNNHNVNLLQVSDHDIVSCETAGVINPDGINLSGSRRRRSADNVRPVRQAATAAALVGAVTINHPMICVFLCVVELCDNSRKMPTTSLSDS